MQFSKQRNLKQSLKVKPEIGQVNPLYYPNIQALILRKENNLSVWLW